MDKRQVVVIHGGETFNTYEDYLTWLNAKELDLEKMRGKRWKSTLQDELGEGYEVLMPSMPNAMNAKYLEWRIWFEKFIPYMEDEVILLGHSLGGIFLTKYLSENVLPRKIRGIFLVAPPFDTRDSDFSLADFIQPGSADRLWSQCGNVAFYFSSDDEVVPISNMEAYKAMLPFARYSIYGDRGHFNQEKFPELVEDIRSLG